MNWRKGTFQPKQPRADITRNQILEAALMLFSQNGYHGTDTKRIAAAANVATGSVYRYFKDKKTIFLSVCEYLETKMQTAIFKTADEIMAQSSAPEEGIGLFIRFTMDVHRENRSFHREVLAMSVQDDDVAALVKAREDRVRMRLLDFFQSLGNVISVTDLEAAAELVYFTVEEVAHQAVIFQSEVGEKRLIEQLAEMLSRYLLKKTGCF